MTPGTEPTVSVCIPAYRRPVELGEAISSVLAQTFVDFEVLIGDDSGDLEPVAHAARDPRMRYVKNRSRLGMAANWSSLLDLARGRYRMLLMDDDRICPRFLEQTVAVLDHHSDVGLVFTNHYFDRQGKLAVRRCRLPAGAHRQFLKPLLRFSPVPVSACLFRAEVWDAVRPLPPLLTADVVFHVRAALQGWSFFYLDSPEMVYRVHEGQLSGDEERFRDDGVACWELFEFDDPECEALRRQHLAVSLRARAATRAKAMRTEDARADLDRVRAITGHRKARDLVLLELSKHQALLRSAIVTRRGLRHVLGNAVAPADLRRRRPTASSASELGVCAPPSSGQTPPVRSLRQGQNPGPR